MNIPELEFKSSRWMDSQGQTVSTCLVYEQVQVEVLVQNQMRKKSITNIVKVEISRGNTFLSSEKLKEESHLLTVPPLSTGKVYVSLTPQQESVYHYTVLIEGKKVFTQPKSFPPRLCVSKKKSKLIIDEPLFETMVGSAAVSSGKLISADTGEGINGAKIQVYDVRHMRKDNLIASVVTANDGSFIIDRIPKRLGWWTNAIDIYAKFEGDDVYRPSISNQCTVSYATNMSDKLNNGAILSEIRTVTQKIRTDAS